VKLEDELREIIGKDKTLWIFHRIRPAKDTRQQPDQFGHYIITRKAYRKYLKKMIAWYKNA
jgi:hypothetical protein